MFPVMTSDLEDAITGTAAGVPFVALPPVGTGPAGSGRAPMIAAWHPTAAPGSPAAMAAAIPLPDVPAWRVYFGLPGTGSRLATGEAAGRGEDWDLLLDGYAPMIEQAAAEFPAARAALRSDLPIDDGPIAVMGGSAGGPGGLPVLTRGAGAGGRPPPDQPGGQGRVGRARQRGLSRLQLPVDRQGSDQGRGAGHGRGSGRGPGGGAAGHRRA